MSVKVFMIPKNHEYINRLRSSLGGIDVKVKILKPFHYSAFMNIAKMLFFRINGYKIVHIHWLYIFPFSFVMYWFYYFCNMLGIKIIWEMHDILPHKYTDRDRKNSKWFYEKADGIIFHCQNDVYRSRELLETNMKKRHIVIPHGNFNELYENRISNKEARRILNIPEDKKVILCFGFIRRYRGYEYLIEATKDMQDTILIVAGKIIEKDIYKKLIDYENKLLNLRVFAKWIAKDEIQIYFNACDVVVLPYTSITTSGVIPLAYAFSKPVITTDIGGLRDVVDERTGILVPPQDAEALREAINKIFKMDFNAMGGYAYEYANKNFSWELNAQKVKELYKSSC